MKLFDDNGNFEGFKERDCGDHRTVGPHRAWCYDCSAWCYPDLPCNGCLVIQLERKLQNLIEQFNGFANDAIRQRYFERSEYFRGLYAGLTQANHQAAQMVKEVIESSNR